MVRTLPAPSPGDLFAPWAALAEIAVAAPVVIGHRMWRIAMGGWPPSARDQRELALMVSEKVDAFTRAALVLATSAPGPATAARALAPMRDRVHGNARRLSRSTSGTRR